MSGNSSLASIIVEDFIRDDAPKAPVVLFALEEQNRFVVNDSNTQVKYKHDLFELNQSLWLALLAQQVNLVVPFSEQVMDNLTSKSLQKYKGDKFTFHQSALQGVAMSSVLGNLLPETSNDKPHHLGDIVKKVLYGPQPNIALPSLKFPILHE